MSLKREIASRIEEFFIAQGWQKQEFAKLIEIAPQHVNKVFSAELDPLKYIDILVDKCGADKSWLLTGVKKYPDLPEVYEPKVKEVVKHENTIRKGLEYKLEATVPAGDGDVVDLTDWYHSEVLDYSPQNHFFLKVDEQFGFSMMPLIKPGDLVLCSIRHKIKHGDIVAAKWDKGKGALKIASFAKNDKLNVILMSYNQAYEPFSVPLATTKMYKVVLIKKM
jgi:hypothetical protein